MTDVCPFSLGVASYNDLQDLNPHMATLIQRSEHPACPPHRAVLYPVPEPAAHPSGDLSGEKYDDASENLRLGELTVSVPPDEPGKQFASVTFAYRASTASWR